MMTIRAGSRLVVGIGALTLATSLAPGARAQNPPAPAPPPPPATVSGAIVDSAGIPIPHAVLSVVGESLRVVTDSQGRFHLAAPPGPRLLAARALGFRPLMWSVTLVSGQEATGRIRLEALSVVLAAITVEAQPYLPSRMAGFYHRKRTGLGVYLDSATIANRFASSTPDLVQLVPGVRVRTTPNDPFKPYISFPRCTKITAELHGPLRTSCAFNDCREVESATDNRPTVAVYVDGFRVFGDPGRILAQINPADVLAMEVYRGPSEIPFEFMSVDCAVIAIWTKY